MRISTVAGCVYFFLCFCYCILPSLSAKGEIREAADSAKAAQHFDHLNKENENFFKFLYAPLVEVCDVSRFEDEFSAEKKRLCDRSVKHLKSCFTELKAAQEASDERETVYNSQLIRAVIHEDVRELSDKYEYYLMERHPTKNEIKEKVDNIVREELFKEFKKAYDEFVKGEKKNASSVIALLLIGQKVAELFEKQEAWEQQALAYQQFAINLAIHSIRIDQTMSTDGITHDLGAIAKNWPEAWGKLDDVAAAIVQPLIDLKKENEKFVNLLYEPLKEECEANRSGYEKSLCRTVGLLKIIVPFLKEKPNETESYSESIRARIHTDVTYLLVKYQQLLHINVREEKVQVIAHDVLISKYKEIYAEFMKEEEKATKVKETNAVESESYQKIVYELLEIGQRVAELFETSEALKQQALAYQQFAINLKIYSIHSRIGHAKHDIHTIAKQWPVHLENLVL